MTARDAGGYGWMFVAFTVNATIVLSPSAVAIWVPSRLNRTAFTWLFVAQRVPNRAPVRALMMCT